MWCQKVPKNAVPPGLCNLAHRPADFGQTLTYRAPSVRSGPKPRAFHLWTWVVILFGLRSINSTAGGFAVYPGQEPASDPSPGLPPPVLGIRSTQFCPSSHTRLCQGAWLQTALVRMNAGQVPGEPSRLLVLPRGVNADSVPDIHIVRVGFFC